VELADTKIKLSQQTVALTAVGEALKASEEQKAQQATQLAELRTLMDKHVGVFRTGEGLKEALARIPDIRERFWREVRVPGSGTNLNQSLEKGLRVADFMEMAELKVRDALHRDGVFGR
jgi:succinate dehydrogenase/fumarate reductase flavoprotein subunit